MINIILLVLILIVLIYVNLNIEGFSNFDIVSDKMNI